MQTRVMGDYTYYCRFSKMFTNRGVTSMAVRRVTSVPNVKIGQAGCSEPEGKNEGLRIDKPRT